MDSLLWLGNIYRLEGNYAEAIRLHQNAQRIDDRNIEILLELSKDLEGAKRYEDALQTLQKILRIEPDNLTGLTRKRDLLIRLENGAMRWRSSTEWPRPICLKRNGALRPCCSPVACTKSVGSCWSAATRIRPDGIFEGYQEDRTFLPAYIGLGEVLIRRQDQGRRRILKKVYAKTHNIIILHRLEELFWTKAAQAKLSAFIRRRCSRIRTTALQFYLGKLYYRLEMVDEAFDILSTVEGPQDQLVDYHKIMANLFLRKQHMNRPSSNSRSASVQKARRRAVRLYRLPAGHHGMVRTVPSVRELEHVCRPPLAGRRVPSIAGRHLDRRTQHSLSGHCFSIRNRVAFAPR